MRHERLLLEIDPAKVTSAGIEHPQLAVVPTRRVRHRQSFADDLVGLHVDHHATVLAAIPPAVDAVALAHRGHVLGLAIDHRQAVQVAPVLRRQLADERRLPDRLETVGLAELRQAGVLRVDEDHLAVLADAEFVDVQVADGLGVARDIALVELAVDDLVRAQHVLEAPQLVKATQVDALRIADHAHGALEDALEERHPPLFVAADQVDPAGLVGGDRQRHPVLGQPAGQAARAGFLDLELGDVDRRLLAVAACRRRCLHRGFGGHRIQAGFQFRLVLVALDLRLFLLVLVRHVCPDCCTARRRARVHRARHIHHFLTRRSAPKPGR